MRESEYAKLASLFGRPDGSTVPRSAVVAEARRWVGVPFRHQGYSRHGVDCGGLTRAVCIELGLLPADFARRLHPDTMAYASAPDGVSMRRACDASMITIDVDEAQAGDLLLFAYDALHRLPQHTAFIGDYQPASERSLIHALGPRAPAQVVEQRLSPRLLQHAVAAYRIPGVA